MASGKKRVERVWEFDVSDPKLHPNGFTIYKVTCKVFPINVQENLTEVVIWKRYNDFKLLSKTLSGLHKSLHRREEFPEFARPKLFGRFDDEVIEERRKSALDLLQFVGHNYHLYRSTVFRDFFKGGERAQKLPDQVSKILRPVKLDLVQNQATELSTNEDTRGNVPIKEVQPKVVSLSPELGYLAHEEINQQDDLIETLWNLPQVPDNMSLNSFDGDDEPDLTDVESALSTPLPDADVSFFDPLKPDPLPPGSDPDGQNDLSDSSSWLKSAFHSCANIQTDVTPVNESVENSFSHEPGDESNEAATPGTDTSQLDTPLNEISLPDFSEFDPLKSRSLSKVECGKGDLDLSSHSPSHSVSGTGTPERKGSSSASSSSTSSPRKQVKVSSAGSPRHPSQTGPSTSEIELGGQYDYIYIAAHQISRAQESEVAGNYETAHAYYMSGVGILLQGVQGDTNNARREAVKRKTAKYLMRVEDLGKRHMTNESLMSPDIELDPSLAYLKGPTSELKNFKVLGTVGKVLLVFDRATDTTYVIKTLHKSEVTPVPRRAAIVPTSCPYMVQFYKFYETDNAIYMLLQYASGDKLWNYLGSYLQYNHSSGLKGARQMCEEEGGNNIYTGQKVLNEESEQNSNGNADVTSAEMSNRDPQLNGEQKTAVETEEIIMERNSCEASKVINVTDKNEIVPINNDTTVMKNRSLSPDVCSTAYVELFAAKPDTTQSGNILQGGVRFTKPEEDSAIDNNGLCDDSSNDGNSKVHPSLDRNCSLTSDEDLHVSTISNVSILEKSTSGGPEFEDTLHSTKRSLDDFSIGSFDDGDSFQRQDSGLSEHITSIPEESQALMNQVESQDIPESHNTVSDLTGKAEIDNESVSDLTGKAEIDNESVSDLTGKTEIDNESERIVQNTKELLESVEKSLQDGRLPSNHIAKLNNSLMKTDNEASYSSIYGNTQSSQLGNITSIKDKDVTLMGEVISGQKDIVANRRHSVNSNSVVRSSPRDRHRSASGSRKGTNIIRMNSKEHCRSASFESDLKSPSKSRTRTISAVFEQLDTVASINKEAIKIPENCIKQWAAEIVVCMNSLHSMGIICRDLNPDNILLGDRGHVLLTFFSQWSNIEQRVDEECLEQLYVAPEVRGITGYSDVCDWWSLGALLYELLVGKSLLSGHPGGVTSHTQLFLPSHLSPEASGLLEELLCHNPRERLGSGITGVEEIKAHPFFSGVDWASLTG